MRQLPWSRLPTIALLGLMLLSSGCGLVSRVSADAQPQRSSRGEQQGPPPVDVAVARTGSIQSQRDYTGTTRPNQDVTLRAQVEGRVITMAVDVGDRVTEGQVVAELDGDILRAAVLQQEAELAAQQSEVTRLTAQLNEARTQVERARLQLQQAQADADRLQRLAKSGAISVQQGELAVTNARTAAQVVRSAEEQVQSQREAIAAAERRVAAQQAAVDQAQQRQAYTVVQSPVDGLVLERLTEAGNLVQPGGAILRVGDFSQVKVSIQVSDLDIAKLRVGQAAQVRLDAFPNQTIRGRISRISPAADPAVRLIPVEVVIPNEAGRIGSGLLARVTFAQLQTERVLIAQSALVEDEAQKSGQQGDQASKRSPSLASPGSFPKGKDTQRVEGGRQTEGSQQAASATNTQGQPRSSQGNRRRSSASGQPAKIFVVVGDGKDAKVTARQVVVGDRGNGQVEILSGLRAGERYVARSGRPLKDGETVRLSILSEKPESN